jgi:ubiquinone biosynthesis UbiH/UbiF/VisC/COQ6 family hydroxylase
MQALNVWVAMEPHATAIQSVRVSDKGHCGWTTLTQKDNGHQPLGFVVDNRSMGQALLAAVAASANIDSRTNTEVERLTPVFGGMDVTLSSGDHIRAELVIIADGANSVLASSLGIQQTVNDYSQSAIVANVAFDLPHQGMAFERFTDKGPLALLPLDGEKGRSSALVWTWPKSEVEQVMAMDDRAFLNVLHQWFGYRLGNFVRVSARTSYPLSLCLANEQVRSNLVLMGNAAHFLHPVAGQGFNLAARDGLRLAQMLQNTSGSLGDLSMLMAYQTAQAQDQARTIGLSHGFNTLFGSRQLGLVGLRNMGMLAIESCDWLRALFIRQMSGRASPKVIL